MRKNGRRGIRILTAFILVAYILGSSIVSFADSSVNKAKLNENSARKSYKDGELIIKFKDGTSSAGISSFASENGLKHKESFVSLNAGLYSVKSGKSLAKTISSLAESNEIEYIQPNYIYYPSTVVEDVYYSDLWGLNNNVKPEVDIDAPEAWDITRGEGDIVVAVIDTGMDINNPDLSESMWTNPGEIVGNGIDDDGNGYIDDIHGWDFYYDDNSVFNDEFYDEHGTHVAGTIAAQANTDGVIGVAPNVKIMSLKFIGPDGGSTSDAIEAIAYAKKMGVKVSNNSWGGFSEGDSVDLLLKQAIEGSNMLFVAAAGNAGDDIDNISGADDGPTYPAGYDSNNILTVAAVDSKGNLADFSNYGGTSVDVGAPGVEIFSTVPAITSGTAAVTVSGDVYDDQIFTAGFGIEDFNSSVDATAFLGKALQSLDIIDADANILLVDDDAKYNVDSFYTSALNALNYNNVTVNTVGSASNDGPGSSALLSHDAVIWVTGMSWGTTSVTTLTTADQNNLISYLNGGGKLVLFGRDALYRIENKSFVTDYLNIEVTLPDYLRNWFIEGVGDTAFEGADYLLDSNDGSYYCFRDHIEPLNDKATPVVKYGGGYYGYIDGTSMAAPHVTGIAALLLSKNPGLTPAQFKTAIIDNGTPLDSLDEGITSTGKMVNAFNALKSVAPMKPDLAAFKSGSNITLSWTGRKVGDFKTYIVERSIDGATYSSIKTTTDNSYSDFGIDLTKTYRYKVKAEDIYDNFLYSNTITGNSISTGGGGGGGGGGGTTVVDPAIDLKLEAALKKAAENGNIEISVVKIVDIESAEMSASTISALSKSGRALTLKGGYSDIEIPASALMTEEVKKYVIDSKAKLTISIKEIRGDAAKKPEANATQGIFKVGDRIFEFSAVLATSEGNVSIKNFGQELKITIKLNAAEASEISKDKLGVYYYNDEKKIWEYVGGMYNPQDNTLAFNTGHFSKYAVMRTESTYTDIDKHWARAEIELMASRHIIEADVSKKFGPDENITRGEIVKMLINALRYNPDKNIELSTPKYASFKDVSTDDPDYSYIETAVKYGITNGKGDGTFGLDDTVTREQLTTMIMRAVGIDTDSDLSILPFRDKDKIPAWAENSIIAAYERGLVMGIEGNEFGVGNLATRAQGAVILKRVMEKTGLIQATEMITGKLVISEIEGWHYELETEDTTYVLIYDKDNKYLAKILNSSVGKEIEVTGYEQGGYSIYMKDKVFKVISITVK